MSKTLFDKVWDSHIVHQIKEGPDVLFIDRHMIHEVTSPVAFLGLKNRSIKVLYPERTFATADHWGFHFLINYNYGNISLPFFPIVLIPCPFRSNVAIN